MATSGVGVSPGFTPPNWGIKRGTEVPQVINLFECPIGDILQLLARIQNYVETAC